MDYMEFEREERRIKLARKWRRHCERECQMAVQVYTSFVAIAVAINEREVVKDLFWLQASKEKCLKMACDDQVKIWRKWQQKVFEAIG